MSSKQAHRKARELMVQNWNLVAALCQGENGNRSEICLLDILMSFDSVDQEDFVALARRPKHELLIIASYDHLIEEAQGFRTDT